MDAARKKRLQKAGWKVGTAQEFLNLSDEEVAYIEFKLSLAGELVAQLREVDPLSSDGDVVASCLVSAGSLLPASSG